MTFDVTNILSKIYDIAKDTRTWLKVLVLVIVGFAGAILFSKTKVKTEDCTTCNNERKELLNALIGIKKDLQAAANTSYSGDGYGLMFASFDTIPKRPNKQQIQMRVEVRKIDSVIYRIQQEIKQDSLKQLKNKS